MEERIARIAEKMGRLLDTYNHANSSYGIQKDLETWQMDKADLIETFSKHPNWDAENFRIVFNQDYTRDFNKDGIFAFNRWAKNTLAKLMADAYVEPRINNIPVQEFKRKLDRDDDILRYAERLNEKAEANGNIHVMGKKLSFLRGAYRHNCEANDKFNREYKKIWLAGMDSPFWYPNEEAKKYLKFENFCELLEEQESNIINDEFVERFKEIYPNINCGVGTRLNKIVGRVCKEYGLDKVVQMRTQEWTDDNGVEHSREKDMGYNYQIAKLGDSINPIKVNRHTIISFNPLDYLTMSFGNGWASCHTPDKENLRGAHGNHYEGQYCSGTLSYMLDESTLIFYTVDKEYDGNEYETQDKINRVTFHINKDKTVMVQGRVYPDGRDGGDTGLSAQFRQVMQAVLSECTGNNNMWTLRKGTSACSEYTYSTGTHYRDYTHYDDCTISFLKGVDHYECVNIGHTPICPNCGEEHYEQAWLCCDECSKHFDAYCSYCDEGINTDRGYYIYCEDNGNYYCCESCANNAGVYYCVDDCEWHDEENCHEEDGEWYHEVEVETEDGEMFHSTRAAEQAGYMMTDNGEWYPEDEVAYDEQREEWFHIDDDTITTEDGVMYMDAESARDAGYLEFNGRWLKEDGFVEDAHTGEMFPNDLDGMIETVDGQYFLNRENAEAEGYHPDDEGIWINEEREVA